jgi:hypothetical protein
MDIVQNNGLAKKCIRIRRFMKLPSARNIILAINFELRSKSPLCMRRVNGLC